MMKRFVAFFLGLSLCLATVGCTNNETTPPQDDKPAPTDDPGDETMSLEPPE